MYQMNQQSIDALCNPEVFPDSRIEGMLFRLYSSGADRYDHPMTAHERQLGNDYEGYTEIWIAALKEEQRRRAGL